MTPFHVHVQTTLHAFQDLSNEWSILHTLALCHASEKEPHFRSSRQLVVPFVILVGCSRFQGSIPWEFIGEILEIGVFILESMTREDLSFS